MLVTRLLVFRKQRQAFGFLKPFLGRTMRHIISGLAAGLVSPAPVVSELAPAEKLAASHCELLNSEAWMREEDELLNRTLQRCLREVRRALDADADVRGLATCKARRVKLQSNVQSNAPRRKTA